MKKRKEKNPTRQWITDWPQNQQSFLVAAQMFLGEGCTATAPSPSGSGGTAGKRDSSLLPPCLFSLLQVHTCLFPLVSQQFSDFCGSTQHCLGTHTTPVKSRESCKHTWICNIFFSDSLWIGRSHFNQDGERLHSSLWEAFFKKNHHDFLLLQSSPSDGPEIPKHMQTITAGSHCSCHKVRLALKGDSANNLHKCRLRWIVQIYHASGTWCFKVQLHCSADSNQALPGSSPGYLSSVKLIFSAPKTHYGKIQLSPGN